MMDIFFVVDKTNALLKATVSEELFISAHVDPINDTVQIRAHLNSEVIGTTQLQYALLWDDTLDKQQIITGRLHDFAVSSYDKFIHPSTEPREPRNSN